MIPAYQLPQPPSDPIDKSYPRFRDWILQHTDRITNSLTQWLNTAVATPLSTLLNGYGPDIASAGTITVTSMVHNVTGTDTITTINQPAGSPSLGPLHLIAVDGFVVGGGGNITNTFMVPAGHMAIMVFHPVTQTWTGIST